MWPSSQQQMPAAAGQRAVGWLENQQLLSFFQTIHDQILQEYRKIKKVSQEQPQKGLLGTGTGGHLPRGTGSLWGLGADPHSA